MQQQGVWGDIPIRPFLENQELADGPYVSKKIEISTCDSR